LLISIKMKKEYNLEIEIPDGVECHADKHEIKCKKGNLELERKISAPNAAVKVEDGKIKFLCKKANRKDIAMVRANYFHVLNMLKGLDEEFVYEMEICYVHFPATAKAEGNKFVITNFLGEKVNRIAKILKGVKVEIKGSKISVSGNDIEKAGQTAANIERASKVPKRDRRVFQDGIFITKKPKGAI